MAVYFLNTAPKILFLVSLASLSIHAQAQQPSLSFVEVGYGQTDVEDLGIDDDSYTGFNVAASFEFFDNFYLPITYYSHSADGTSNEENSFNQITQILASSQEIALSELTIGIGYKYDISDRSILATDLSYVEVDVDVDSTFSFQEIDNQTGEVLFQDSGTSSGGAGDNGLALRSTLQTLFDSGIQVNLGLQHKVIKVESETLDDTVGIVELLYFVGDQYGVKFGAYIGDENQFTVSARYAF